MNDDDLFRLLKMSEEKYTDLDSGENEQQPGERDESKVFYDVKRDWSYPLDIRHSL